MKFEIYNVIDTRLEELKEFTIATFLPEKGKFLFENQMNDNSLMRKVHWTDEKDVFNSEKHIELLVEKFHKN